MSFEYGTAGWTLSTSFGFFFPSSCGEKEDLGKISMLKALVISEHHPRKRGSTSDVLGRLPGAFPSDEGLHLRVSVLCMKILVKSFWVCNGVLRRFIIGGGSMFIFSKGSSKGRDFAVS